VLSGPRRIFSCAVDKATLLINESAPAIQSEKLYELMALYSLSLKRLKLIEKACPFEVAESLLKVPFLDHQKLSDESEISTWCELLELAIGVSPENQLSITVVEQSLEISTDVESGDSETVFLPQIQILIKGSRMQFLLDKNFFSGNGYLSLESAINEFHDLLEDSALVERNEKQLKDLAHFSDAYYWLMEEAKKGVNIQRYKGLGEMNADQLQETTMDPAARRMLKINIEDAVGADRIFNTLMGDQVEPRREFIDRNALSVANLDV